ncbi:hypothetical protein SAMN04487948_11297 [Halogranum amylolyticum]|uniref:Uncharacterized protein n=1 Tax=Halogranum amylolyticum TaxID=660520 RepID=A0A1H8USZ6_9EURY|nr:hypothetical protein [Halogranum amylolyticum]SEP06291.1 hypothetical protein SAMN04487948_11297 [Halogranum amylolyticum]
MTDEELGQATIVYEDPDGETVEKQVDNEHVAYFQDHWILKTDEQDGQDIVRRIPLQRVYYVERSVEEFEEEVATVRNQVESLAGNLRQRLFGSEQQDQDQESGESLKINVGDSDDEQRS